jgi:hypothetical protein
MAGAGVRSIKGSPSTGDARPSTRRKGEDGVSLGSLTVTGEEEVVLAGDLVIHDRRVFV